MKGIITRFENLVSIKNNFLLILLVTYTAILVIASISLVRSREQYSKQAENTIQNLCMVLSDNLKTSYEKIDLAVLGVKDLVEQQIASGGINGPRLEAFIRNQLARMQVLYALRTANAKGIIDHGNEVVPNSGISVADRDYFVRLKNDPDAGLVFSKPLIGRVTGAWAVILARRINRPDGSFGGVAYGAIQLDKVKAYFSSLVIGKEGAIILRDSDLAVIVRQGGTKDVTGQSAVSPEFRELVKSGHTSGFFRVVSPVDHVERIYSFIKMEKYGQYLIVGLGSNDVFAPWRKELYQMIIFLGIFFIITGTATLMTYKMSMKQKKTEAELLVLSGLLPICSNCKKIRDDSGYWSQIETYISTHSEAQFTHSMCPDCVRLLYPEIAKRNDKV